MLQVVKLNQKLAEIDRIAKALRAGSDLIGKEVAAVTLAAQKGAEKVKDAVSEKREAWGERAAERRAKAKARIDEIVKKMPKRLLRAFPTLSSKKNPDSVPLARESMEKDGRAGKEDVPAEQKGEKDDSGT